MGGVFFKTNIMRKVKIDFFCIKTKINYKAGDEYKGKRTDINHVFEEVKKQKKQKKQNKKHPKTKKNAIEKK